MATGRSRNTGSTGPKRTPKVAGRNAPRVSVGKPEGVGDSDSAAVGSSKAAGEPTAATSGVERKRRAAQAIRETEAERREVLDAGAPAMGTSRAYRIAGLLGGVAVVVGAIAAVFAFHPGADVNDNRAFVDRAETDQLISQGKAAICAPFNVDYKSLDRSFEEIGKSLTGTALAEVHKSEKATRQMFAQAKATQKCEMVAFGVTSLDGDHATVVAEWQLETLQDGMPVQGDAGTTQTPRAQVSFVKDDDRWKVASIADF